MQYTINIIEPVDVFNATGQDKYPGDIRAYVSVEIDNVIHLNGIRIRETNNRKLFVDMPRRMLKDTNENLDSSRYIIPTNKDFAKELYTNIIKTFVSDKKTYSNAEEPDETKYKVSLYPVNDDDGAVGIVNLEIEDCIRINGFRLKKNYDGAHFFSNPEINGSDWNINAVYFKNADFENTVLNNAKSLYLDRQCIDKYNDELADIEKKIQTESNNISMIETLYQDYCKKIDEAVDKDSEERIINALGAATYSYYETMKKLDKLMERREEIQKEYDVHKLNKNKKTKARWDYESGYIVDSWEERW